MRNTKTHTIIFLVVAFLILLTPPLHAAERSPQIPNIDYCPRVFLEDQEKARQLRTTIAVIEKAAAKLERPVLTPDVLQSSLQAAFGEKFTHVDALTNLHCILNQTLASAKEKGWIRKQISQRLR